MMRPGPRHSHRIGGDNCSHCHPENKKEEVLPDNDFLRLAPKRGIVMEAVLRRIYQLTEAQLDAMLKIVT
jgi:hypothetical protein